MDRNKYKTSELMKEGQQVTAPTINWRISALYISFVVQQTFILRMNTYGENCHLLVAAKRCG